MIPTIDRSVNFLETRPQISQKQKKFVDRLSNYFFQRKEHPNPSSFYAYLQEKERAYTPNSFEEVEQISQLQQQFTQVLAQNEAHLAKDVRALSPGDFFSLDRLASLSLSHSPTLEEACSLGLTEKVQEILLSTNPSLETVFLAIRNVLDPTLQRKLLEKLSKNPVLRRYFDEIQARDPEWICSLVISGIRAIEKEGLPFAEQDLKTRMLVQTLRRTPFSSDKHPIIQRGEIERTQTELQAIEKSSPLITYLKNSRILTQKGDLAKNPTLLESRTQLEYVLEHLAKYLKKTSAEIEALGQKLWVKTLSEDQQKEEALIAKMQEGLEIPVSYDLILWDMAVSHLNNPLSHIPIRENTHSLYEDIIESDVPSSEHGAYFACMKKLDILYQEIKKHLNHPLYAIAIDEAYSSRDFTFLLSLQKALFEYRIPSKKMGKIQEQDSLSLAYGELDSLIASQKKQAKILEFFSNTCFQGNPLEHASFQSYVEDAQKFARETNFSFLKDFFLKKGVLQKGQYVKGAYLERKAEQIRLHKDLFLYLMQLEAQKMKKTVPTQKWSLTALDDFAREIVYEKFSKLVKIILAKAPQDPLASELNQILAKTSSQKEKLAECQEKLRGRSHEPYFSNFHNYLENPFPCPEKMELNPWQESLIQQDVLGQALLHLGVRWKADRSFQENFFEQFSALYFLVQGMKGTVNSVYSPARAFEINTKLSQALELGQFSKIEQILKTLSTQNDTISSNRGFPLVGKKLDFSANIFEELRWFTKQSFQESLNLPPEIWNLCFPYHQKVAHLNIAFQALYTKCSEEVRRLSMPDVYIHLLDMAISQRDTKALEWIYRKIAHERYLQEIRKLQLQGSDVEDLVNLEKAWEEVPLEEKIPEIKRQLCKNGQKHLLQTLESFPGPYATYPLTETEIRERGEAYLKECKSNKHFQIYLKAHSFSPEIWDENDVEQMVSLYKQFLLEKKRELLSSDHQLPYRDKDWKTFLIIKLIQVDPQYNPTEYEQLLSHLNEEWKSYLLHQLEEIDFFDLEALDQIITLAKCENRQKAMRVCGKLQLAKHAAFLVMQFPASKTDWKDLLAHTLPPSIHIAFFKELLQTPEGKSYFFRLAKRLNKEETSSLWHFLEEVVDTVVSTPEEKTEGSFLPLQEHEALHFFFDYYLQAAKSAEVFFKNSKKDTEFFGELINWFENEGKTSLLKRFLDKYSTSTLPIADEPPIPYKLHILRIYTIFLKNVLGLYDGSIDFFQANDLITEEILHRYLQSHPSESPLRIDGESLLNAYKGKTLSLQEMQDQISSLVQMHTGESLEVQLDPYLSFSEEDLKKIFPWKPLERPDSLLGQYLQKDGIASSSLEKFLESYLDARNLVISIITSFQERYSHIKGIINEKESGTKKTYYQKVLVNLETKLVQFTKTNNMDILSELVEELICLEFQAITDTKHPKKSLAELRLLVENSPEYSETKKTDFIYLLEGGGFFVSWDLKVQDFERWISNPLFSYLQTFSGLDELTACEQRKKMQKIRFILNAIIKREIIQLELPFVYTLLLDFAKCNEQDYFSTWMVNKILYTRYEKNLGSLAERDIELEALHEEVKGLPLQERIKKTKHLLEQGNLPHRQILLEVLTQIPWDSSGA